MKHTAQMLKALSDETRLRIINLLQAGGRLCVCDLMAVLELPQSTASRHLAYLKKGGLVNDARKGVWMYYSLKSDKRADILLKTLETLLAEEKQAANDRQRLTEYLASKDVDACS